MKMSVNKSCGLFQRNILLNMDLPQLTYRRYLLRFLIKSLDNNAYFFRPSDSKLTARMCNDSITKENIVFLKNMLG